MFNFINMLQRVFTFTYKMVITITTNILMRYPNNKETLIIIDKQKSSLSRWHDFQDYHDNCFFVIMKTFKYQALTFSLTKAEKILKSLYFSISLSGKFNDFTKFSAWVFVITRKVLKSLTLSIITRLPYYVGWVVG